jgi:uncharacterized protein YjdB
MKRITLLLLLGLFLLAAVVPGCKKEEITNIEYSVIWKGSLETAPANPEAGWAYYNTKLGQSFIYDGASWQVMSENGKDGKDGKDGVDGKDGQNGIGLVWKGELEAAPSDAETNWAYYNSTEKKSFIYDGTTWLVLAKDGAQGEKGADGQNGKDGTNGTNGTDGGTSAGFVWKGELDANPSEPQTNWAYYNKTDKKAYIYDGAKWSILAQDGKDGQNGNDGQPGTNGNDGTIIVWKGSLTAAPASPAKGWCYYNSTEKKSYMYDGTTWQMIAQDGKDAPIPVTGITLNKTTAEITVGGTETLSVTSVLPDNATDKTYSWSSTNTSVATVDADGKVTAVAGGTTTISATANDGSGVSATCTVIVATVVTWNSSDISGQGNTFTKDGVTITAAMIDFNDKNFLTSGTITTTLGNFTKIEVTGAQNYNNMGSGWTISNKKATWTGTASSSVNFGNGGSMDGICGMGDDVTFVFTILGSIDD